MKKHCTPILMLLLFVLPAGTSYELHDYSLGGLGSSVMEGGTYAAIGVAGDVSGLHSEGSLYNLGPGLLFARQAHVPPAPTVTNTGNFYNKLHVVINTGGNPSDTLYALAISDDSFTTTSYIQADNTIGADPVFLTHDQWGGEEGDYVVGLSSNTTYTLKVSAMHTKYTQTQYSETASAATIAPTLSLDIDIASTDGESAPPYVISMGTLVPGSVTTATEKIWLDIATNGLFGGFVYLYGSNGGLHSAAANATIPAVDGNLAVLSEGYGVRIDAITTTSGDPFDPVLAYSGTADNVGSVDTTPRLLGSTSGATNGRVSLVLKAKNTAQTRAASDYADIITIIASGIH